MDLKGWFVLGFCVRVLVILYGVMHDAVFSVQFTDVDYEVFSDAAKFVLAGGSPYNRQTYRYPPLIAWLLVPNSRFALWGKLLFSMIDILVAWLISLIILSQGFPQTKAKQCALFWLLNPVSIIISARGNSDALIAAVVLICLDAAIKGRPTIAGISLALAIHIRLYPIMFSLPIYLSFNQSVGLIRKIWPNINQLKLVCSCAWFLLTATAICYYLYGDEYLHQSIFYHLIRKDTKHNYSLFFYLQYLDSEQGIFLFLPQAIQLLVLSLAFHCKANLAFCLFSQTFVAVTYNPVVTSQYWVWVLSLLPTCIPRLRLEFRSVLFLTSLWGLAQIAWLVPAFLLEFRGRDTFFFIWLQGLGVFCANVAVLGRLIESFVTDPRKKLE